jgi:cell division protein FtsI (penicillin-binding protein 3)
MQWVAIFFAFSGLVLVLRAFQLHVLWNLKGRVNDQQHERVVIQSKRGAIMDRNGAELAISVEVESVAVRPRHVRDPERMTLHLAQALRLKPQEVRKKLKSPSPFVWVKRFAIPREVERVRALDLPGVEIQGENRRYYPQGRLGSAVIGFAGTDSKGLEGIELSYDKLIRGESATREVPRDARRRLILTGGIKKVELPGGSKVYLTLDLGLQHVLERELERTVAESKAKGGMAVAVDPQTGAILAMASAPGCNLNLASRCPPDQVRNRAVADTFEPGSIFKMILAAAALEEDVVRLGDVFYCENGKYPFGGRIIHDAHEYGWLPFEGIIQRSSNIGVTKIAEKLGARKLHEYIERFGFGRATGIELPGEVAGVIRNVESWQEIDLATHAFGQGISVTGIQMAMAYAAVANGGLLMRPYLVDRIIDASGHTVSGRPTLVRRVISEDTARTLTSILELVVKEGGTGTKARVDGFRVAGKTGTAQKVNPMTLTYIGGKRIASFAGFVPSDSPRLALLVVIDEPSTNVYGGIVAAPSFRNIARDSLMRLEVSPELPPTPVGDAPPLGQTLSSQENRGDQLPPVFGLSLRDALLRVSDWGIDLNSVEVRGSGYVVDQSIMPGSSQGSVGKLILTLAPIPHNP